MHLPQGQDQLHAKTAGLVNRVTRGISAVSFHLRMILSENRYPLFGIMR
jgi:hypothetical protein